MSGSRLLAAFVAGSSATVAGFVLANHFDGGKANSPAAATKVSERDRFKFRAEALRKERKRVSWDDNWDGRDPVRMVKSPREYEADDPEKAASWRDKVDKMKPANTRHIVLIRHGQYNFGNTDEERFLTPLGEKQAAMTGKRLSDLMEKFKSMYKDENGNQLPVKFRVIKSTMQRATQTADIILKELATGVDEVKSCDLIREGAPIEPEPPTKAWNPSPHEFYIEGSRIEAGFRRYIHRAEPKPSDDTDKSKSTVKIPTETPPPAATVDILVCHGNVIRYFVCRALQFPPDAWLRFEMYNGSMTHLYVRPSGRVGIQTMNDAGYMPKEMLTHN